MTWTDPKGSTTVAMSDDPSLDHVGWLAIVPRAYSAMSSPVGATNAMPEAPVTAIVPSRSPNSGANARSTVLDVVDATVVDGDVDDVVGGGSTEGRNVVVVSPVPPVQAANASALARRRVRRAMRRNYPPSGSTRIRRTILRRCPHRPTRSSTSGDCTALGATTTSCR